MAHIGTGTQRYDKKYHQNDNHFKRKPKIRMISLKLYNCPYFPKYIIRLLIVQITSSNVKHW